MEEALIGAGCFWGIEEYYRNIDGIKDTKVGYSGGIVNDPTYETVCTGNTGHVEVVKIKFDENIISYQKILDHFWNCHDPTQFNRQGPDIGSQYRSAIFYYSENQKALALESKKQKQLSLNKEIVTEIKEANKFYLAEEYHQLYIHKNNSICLSS